MTQFRINSTPQARPTHNLAATGFALCCASLLTGCAGVGLTGSGAISTPAGAAIHVAGSIHGGQQPVTGALIQIYTVGTTGLRSASTPLISTTLTTSDGSGTANSNANAGNGNNTLPPGSFTLPSGSYSCSGATPGTQVYLTATGGNPGAGTNGNLSLVAALGSCANLLANANTTFLNVNEVTTVAAAYALAPFAASLTSIGASGSPTGLVNAFANAAALANNATGGAGGAGLPAGTIVPTAELNTLANIMAACVNSTGAASSACTVLFGATSATDTYGAALAMAKAPGAAAITALYSLSSPAAPFQPTLSSTPKDFSVALSFTANGGLLTPYGIALDTSGNAWITNAGGSTVTELSPTGAVLATPTATGLAGPRGVAIDRAGNVWVANTLGNSVVKLTLTSGSVSGTGSFTAGSINTPVAIALDSQGNAFVANLNGNSVTELNSTGAAQNGSPFTGGGNIILPSGIALDSTGNVYVTSAQGGAAKLSNTGTFSAVYNDAALQGPMALTVDASSRVFVAGSTTGSAIAGAISEFGATGASALATPVTSGSTPASGIATDGTSTWVANSSTSGGLVQLVYGSATTSSPAGGFGALSTPVGVAVDGSGSVWTTNTGNNTVSQFIGLAAPVVTPISVTVGP